MHYLEQITLVGRATKDAELVTSKNGNEFATFSLAVNRPSGKEEDKEGKKEKQAEKGENTSFYSCMVFGKERAAYVLKNVAKGDPVFVQGRPDVGPYLSKTGEAKAEMKVLVNEWSAMKK